MTPQRSPPQPKATTPSNKVNEKGEIISWNSAGEDGKLLKVLVEQGLLENMTPAVIRAKYPQFMKYSYNSFNGALRNARNALNNAIHNRASGAAGGMNPKSNLFLLDTVSEGDDADDEDYTYHTLDDDFSQLSFDDGTVQTQSVAHQSVAYLAKMKQPGTVAPACRTSKAHSPGQKKVRVPYGATSVALPYILDHWKDVSVLNRISLQIHLLSGMNEHTLLYVRLSTDQKQLVLMTPMSKYMIKPVLAFNTYILEDSRFKLQAAQTAVMLSMHPKVIARQHSVSKLWNRDSQKELFFEQRIALGRECSRGYAGNDKDLFFYGKKPIRYPDDSVHLHIELLCDSGDNYEADVGNHDESIINASPHHIPQCSHPRSSIPASVGMAREQDEQQYQMDHEEEPFGEEGHGGAIVLQGEYDGEAYRSKSVKSTKRTAAHQENHLDPDL